MSVLYPIGGTPRFRPTADHSKSVEPNISNPSSNTTLAGTKTSGQGWASSNNSRGSVAARQMNPNRALAHIGRYGPPFRHNTHNDQDTTTRNSSAKGARFHSRASGPSLETRPCREPIVKAQARPQPAQAGQCPERPPLSANTLGLARHSTPRSHRRQDCERQQQHPRPPVPNGVFPVRASFRTYLFPIHPALTA